MSFGWWFDPGQLAHQLHAMRPDYFGLATLPERYFETFPRLAERLDQLAGWMSGRERKTLPFVRAILEDTQVTILDEPSEGVQPENIKNMQNCTIEKQAERRSFVLVEQNLGMLMPLADKHRGLDFGRTVFEAAKGDSNREYLLLVLSV